VPFYNQTHRIEVTLMNAMSMGTTNLRDVYTIAVEALGVPRPTVRRVAKNLLVKLKARSEVLGC